VSISDTFKRVKKWVEELKAFNKNTILAIAGNKCDLNVFDTDKEEVIKYANEENAKHFYTSAKTGEGLDDIFEYITKEIAAVQQISQGNIKDSKSKKLLIGKGTLKSEGSSWKC
jgi:Ras-related protein Rab-21